jgi:hypothetical protein
MGVSGNDSSSVAISLLESWHHQSQPPLLSLRLYLLAVRFTRTLMVAIGLSDVDTGEAQDS